MARGSQGPSPATVTGSTKASSLTHDISHDMSAPPNKEREITRVRARIAELEADLGI